MDMKNTNHTLKKKFVAGCVMLCLILAMVSSMLQATKIYAATFTDINQLSVFLKQENKSTCTLSATAMMLRRAAMLSGNSNWQSITESSIRSTAWVEGTGLKWSFTYEGLTVAKANDLGGSADKLISLLKSHPEGIVIYDRTKPHAVLVTDYTNGVFYCAEPAAAYPSGRISIEQAYVTLSSVKDYWYVSSPKLILEPELVVTPKPPVVQEPATTPQPEATVTPQPTTAPTPRPDISNKTEAFGLGDLDGNAVIELADAQMTLKGALKIRELDEVQTKAADVDNSGDIELADAQKILKTALLIEEL